jgi:hypothetical protein
VEQLASHGLAGQHSDGAAQQIVDLMIGATRAGTSNCVCCSRLRCAQSHTLQE